jgi:DNA-binding HxlR family transcriptional regulator
MVVQAPDGAPAGGPLDLTRRSLGRALAIVGERWTLLVLRESFAGVRRFEAFQRNLGIARNILADRLHKLVAAGVLERRRYQDRPARYEYCLTERGLDLYPALLALLSWSERHLAPAAGDPPATLTHERCGQAVEPHLVCGACGGELRAREVRPGGCGEPGGNRPHERAAYVRPGLPPPQSRSA